MAKANQSMLARTVRWTVRGLLCLLILAAILAGAGAVWNVLALRHYQSIAGIPGKLYQVDGRTMHIYCTGSGSPTVVFDAGLGNDSMIWGKNQPELSKTTRVCSYDRAGFGWSEPRPGVRDSNAISAELHGLLQAAEINGPIILMGHSISGIHMRNFTARYPQQVVGIVFVDGSFPRQDLHFPKAIEAEQKKYEDLLYPLIKAATATGIMRALGQCTEVTPGMEPYAAWIKADSCHPSQFTSIARETAAVPLSGDETLHAGPFGNLPILIFTQDTSQPMKGLPIEVGTQMSTAWNGLQEETKKLSTNSRRIIAKGSSHYVQVDRSELVNREVTSFIEQVRTGTVSPQNGTTTTQ